MCADSQQRNCAISPHAAAGAPDGQETSDGTTGREGNLPFPTLVQRPGDQGISDGYGR